jgi:hypothetical protein
MGIFEPYESAYMRDRVKRNKRLRLGCLLMVAVLFGLGVIEQYLMDHPHHTTKRTVHKLPKTRKAVVPQTEEEK